LHKYSAKGKEKMEVLEISSSPHQIVIGKAGEGFTLLIKY
jgi:hypothetical protein